MADEFTLGVEEEYSIIDPETRELRPDGQRILKSARKSVGEAVQPELRLSQIETATCVCRSLAEVRAEVTELRSRLLQAAEREGGVIVATGTHPFSAPQEQPFTPKERYQKTEVDFQELARELVIFGCHVHVGLDDPELAVQVMNRARVWLAPLLALSANSPFWCGADSGYASFRTELWSRWPMAGQPAVFQSRAEYDELIRALVQCGAIEDTTRIYWDIRLPERVPTIEFRVTDVCGTVDEAVMIAGLVRGLTRTCWEEARQGRDFRQVRPEILKAAHWRAARYGLFGELIDPLECRSVPATELVERLLEYIRPALETSGEWSEVAPAVQRVLEHGNGAARQRDVFQRTGRLEDVVDHLVAEMRASVTPGATER